MNTPVVAPSLRSDEELAVLMETFASRVVTRRVSGEVPFVADLYEIAYRLRTRERRREKSFPNRTENFSPKKETSFAEAEWQASRHAGEPWR